MHLANAQAKHPNIATGKRLGGRVAHGEGQAFRAESSGICLGYISALPSGSSPVRANKDRRKRTHGETSGVQIAARKGCHRGKQAGAGVPYGSRKVIDEARAVPSAYVYRQSPISATVYWRTAWGNDAKNFSGRPALQNGSTCRLETMCSDETR